MSCAVKMVITEKMVPWREEQLVTQTVLRMAVAELFITVYLTHCLTLLYHCYQ